MEITYLILRIWENISRLLCIVALSSWSMFSYAQQQKKQVNLSGGILSGVVQDNSGEIVIGASVVVKGTTNGTITDVDGKFSLENVKQGDLIQISFIGYTTQEIKCKGLPLKVVLKEDTKTLDEIVVVGYGTMRKGNLTGSISSVKSKTLTVSPVSNVSNALAGRLPGLTSVQSSGQPGHDAASLKIRGFGNALVIVDGVESNLINIDLNSIENISILKDGSASIYGARAGNGVILVTTKRGINSCPKFSVNFTTTWQRPVTMMKPLSSGQKAELARESHLNTGASEETAPYTAEQVAKYYAGTDPLYPNTDWKKIVMRDWSPMEQGNLSVRGGSDKIKYYGFLGVMNQETMIKKNGGKYLRYNLQSNIDAKFTNEFSFKIDLSGSIEKLDAPARNMGVGGYLWQDYWSTSPMYPATLPDPTKVSFAEGGGTGGIHVSSNSDLSGYYKSQNYKYKAVISFIYKPIFLPGLTAKVNGFYAHSNSFDKNFTKNVILYQYDPSTQIYTPSGSFGENKLDHSVNKSTTLTFQGILNYEQIFKEKHNLNSSAIFECIDSRGDGFSAGRRGFITTSIDYLFAGSPVGMYNGGSAWESGRMSFVGRVNYGFNNKYLIETIFRADASSMFAKSKRWGYFPSVSLGWVIANENFLKNIQWLNNLKLRASYGRSGNDAVGSFQYLSGYEYSAQYIVGNEVQKSLSSTGLPNPNLTWETMDIYNVGVDFSLFHNSLYGELDVFYRNRKGIPARRLNSLPSTFGSPLPQENLNEINHRGFEFMTGYRDSYKGLVYDVSANISYTRAKWGYFEEPIYEDPDQKRLNLKTGNWCDRMFGYKSDGLFTSEEEIKSLGYDQDGHGNKTLRPGDVRLIDVNGDKLVDWRDQVEIGKDSEPNWMFGFNTNFAYRNFDLSMLFQGAFGFYKNFVLGANTSKTFNKRWTEGNNDPHALIPRVGSIASTAQYTSDYTFKSSNYLRLKTASLGYTLPKEVLSKLGIDKLRIYVSGVNLFTFSRMCKYGVDPEAPNIGYYYPQQKTVSLGLNLTL